MYRDLLGVLPGDDKSGDEDTQDDRHCQISEGGNQRDSQMTNASCFGTLPKTLNVPHSNAFSETTNLSFVASSARWAAAHDRPDDDQRYLWREASTGWNHSRSLPA
jgi:hypothetical protein